MEYRGLSLKLPITLGSLAIFLGIFLFYIMDAFEGPQDFHAHPDFHNGNHHQAALKKAQARSSELSEKEISTIIDAATKGEFQKVAELTNKAVQQHRISEKNRQFLGQKIYPMVHALPVKTKNQITQNYYGYKALHNLFPGNELYEHREKLYRARTS